MIIFGEAKRRLDEIENTLKESFQRVKQDNQALSQWISYLYNQNNDLVQKNQQMNNVVRHLHHTVLEVKRQHQNQLTRQDVRTIIDSHYSMQPLLDKLKLIDERLTKIEQARAQKPAQPSFLQQPKSTFLQEKVVRRITKRSKDYLKTFVQNIIQKYGKISALQIRDMVVEEQGLCSKSSFYRILEELEQENTVGVIVGKKEKTYISKQKTAQI